MKYQSLVVSFKEHSKYCLKLVLLFICFSNCNSKEKTYKVERSFFKEMKEYYVLPKDTQEFNRTKNENLVLFGLSKDAYLINDKYYYKIINPNSDGQIPINGFIRMEGNKLYVIARQYDSIPKVDSLNKEQLFLDFDAKPEQNWDVCFSNHIYSCVNIRLTDTITSPSKNLIYKFGVTENLKSRKKTTLPHGSQITYVVTKKNGFSNFIIFQERSARVITLLPYVAIRDTVFR